MEWLYYLLEANLYLLLFYGFYCVFLKNETFYTSNRYFLILSSVSAFVIPIMQLGFLNPTPIVDNLKFPPPILYTADQLANINLTPAITTIDYTSYLYPVYLFIAFCFTVNLTFSILKIIRLWQNAKKQTSGYITLVELNEDKSAFSFFNLLFIHPHLAEIKAVLRHEMVHIKQKHSLDILFFEIIQIICWFNPIIYFLKKDIKLVHEYLADELSTNAEMQKHEYALFLIENSFGIVPQRLTNQIFNQSILKRRINMLNKKRTAGWARLRLLLVLPLAGAMLCTSTMAFTKDYGFVDLLPEKNKTIIPYQEAAKKDQGKFKPPIVKPDEKQTFYTRYGRDKITGKPVFSEKRYILINGKVVKDLPNFYGVSNAENVLYLTKSKSIAKYGNKAVNGAVEITGGNIKYFNKMTLPPPPPVEPPPPGYKTKRDQVKFPPPVVKPDGKNLKTPPPVEPPPPGYKPKRDQVKFPPPVVRQDNKAMNTISKTELTGNINDRAKGTISLNSVYGNNTNAASTVSADSKSLYSNPSTEVIMVNSSITELKPSVYYKKSKKSIEINHTNK